MNRFHCTDANSFSPTAPLLIVDDHDTIREALRFVFSAAGMRHVVEAATSDEAVSAVQRQTFALVLLDISLGQDSGIDTLRKIKTLSPSLPVLMHSFHDSASLLANSFHAGAAGYLVKGVDRRELIAAVHQAACGESTWTADQKQRIHDVDSRFPELHCTTKAGRVRTL